MFKAIEKFEVNGNVYKIGDKIPREDFEGKLIRDKKIKFVADKPKKETKKVKEVVAEVVPEVITEVIPEATSPEELLVDDSSSVDVTDEVEVEEETDAAMTEEEVLEIVFTSDDDEELEEIGRDFGIEVDRRKNIEDIRAEVLEAIGQASDTVEIPKQGILGHIFGNS